MQESLELIKNPSYSINRQPCWFLWLVYSMAFTKLNTCVRIKSSTLAARTKQHGCNPIKLTTMLISMPGFFSRVYFIAYTKLTTCVRNKSSIRAARNKPYDCDKQEIVHFYRRSIQKIQKKDQVTFTMWTVGTVGSSIAQSELRGTAVWNGFWLIRSCL